MPAPPKRQTPSRRIRRLKLPLAIVIALSSTTFAYTQPIEDRTLRRGSGQASAAARRHSTSDSTSDRSSPSASQLLQDVIAQLPREPLTIRGALKVRKRRGIVIKELQFELFANWAGRPAFARYTIRDAGGTNLEQLTVIRMEGQAVRVAYASGSPLLPSPPPDLFASIQETDMSWMDLTLSFLWWKQALG